MNYNYKQRGVIFDYENLLLGRSHRFSEHMFSDRQPLEYRRKKAGLIWNYAITHYLGWTAKEAVLYMTSDIAEKLLLNRVYKHIEVDPARVFFRDYRFILQYAFPGEIKYDIRTEAIAVYERVCKLGKWCNNTENYRYPKKFFSGIEGQQRADTLLNYVVAMYMGDRSSEEMYDFFSQHAKAKKWITAKCLDVPLDLIYNDEPLDYFHTAIDERVKDDLLYYSNKTRIYLTQIMKKQQASA